MAQHQVQQEVADYLSGLHQSNSEEAKNCAFKNLLNRLFQDSQDSQAAKDVVNMTGRR